MNSKAIRQLVVLLAMVSLFFACTGNTKQQNKSNTDTSNVDSVKTNEKKAKESQLKSKKRKTKDSSEVAILSIKGKLLRIFKYPIDNSEDGFYKYINYIRGYPKSETLTGDFNGDGKKEKAYFLDRGSNKEDCQNNPNAKSCMGIIRFTDKNIKPILIQYCPFGQFKNEGDLNNDGKDEIGVLPGWYSSACRYYHVFTYKDSLWIEACPQIGSTENMREAGITVIEKDRDSSGYAIIRESTENYYQKHPGYHPPQEYALASCAGSNVVEYRLKLK